jgi:hypothetical protein
MANFAARKWPERMILDHLSQGFKGPWTAPGPPAVGHLASEVAGACVPNGPLKKYLVGAILAPKIFS